MDIFSTQVLAKVVEHLRTPAVISFGYVFSECSDFRQRRDFL